MRIISRIGDKIMSVRPGENTGVPQDGEPAVISLRIHHRNPHTWNIKQGSKQIKTAGAQETVKKTTVINRRLQFSAGCFGGERTGLLFPLLFISL